MAAFALSRHDFRGREFCCPLFPGDGGAALILAFTKLAAVPALAVFACAERYLAAGATGAVKGWGYRPRQPLTTVRGTSD
jgi:hypothetical protein